jgi:hypothetical protein
MVKTQNRFRKLENQKFGRLLVLERDWEKTTPQNRWKVYWKCICDCGKLVSVRAEHLKENKDTKSFHTKSCGCLQKEKASENGKRNSLPKGEYAKRCLYQNYRKRCQKKNLKFELSRNEFDKLIESNCYYCNAEPSNFFKNRKNVDFSLKYNGIDRKDSNKGYEYDNVLPCCGDCNYMKSDLSFEFFIDKIKKIRDNLKI